MSLYEQVKRTFDEALKSGAVETLEMQTEYMDTSFGVPLPLRLPGKRREGDRRGGSHKGLYLHRKSKKSDSLDYFITLKQKSVEFPLEVCYTR